MAKEILFADDYIKIDNQHRLVFPRKSNAMFDSLKTVMFGFDRENKKIYVILKTETELPPYPKPVTIKISISSSLVTRIVIPKKIWPKLDLDPNDFRGKIFAVEYEFDPNQQVLNIVINLQKEK